MASKLTLAAFGIAGLIAAKILLDFVFNPMNAVRADLAEELSKVPAHASVEEATEHDYAVLHNTIAAKPSLWQELVAPAARPAPKAPPAPPPAEAPDVAAMLKDLGMAPGQIGKDRMRVIPPGRPKGDWMRIGDTFNGCKLVSFTRDEAVFSYYWEAKKKELKATLPRPLR